MAHPSDTLFVPFSLQNSKSLILRHAARVGNNRHRVFVLLCTRCLKPCLRGVRLQPLARPSSRRKEAQGENALCLRAEVSVSDKCRGRLERRVRYDRNMFFVVPRKATLYIELTLPIYRWESHPFWGRKWGHRKEGGCRWEKVRVNERPRHSHTKKINSPSAKFAPSFRRNLSFNIPLRDDWNEFSGYEPCTALEKEVHLFDCYPFSIDNINTLRQRIPQLSNRDLEFHHHTLQGIDINQSVCR